MTSITYGDSSGDRGDDAERYGEMQRRYRRVQAPDNEIPGGVAYTAVIAQGADAAVAVVGLLAYSTGWTATLTTRLRTMPEPSKMHDLGRALGGGPFGNEDAVLLGLEYSDGRSAANVQTGLRPQPGGGDDAALIIRPGGGGGGGRSYDSRFWVSPLPPPGPVTIICAWPAMGIEEARTEFDASLILEAAALATVLWEWEPYAQPVFGTPDLPKEGWFSQWGQAPRPNEDPGPTA